MTGPLRISLAEARRRDQGHAHLDADPTYARVFVRKVSPAISWAIVRFSPLSADAVTGLGMVLGTVAGILIVTAHPGGYVLAIALLQLAYLLDVADGEVARIRGTAGRRGRYLDLIGHFIQNRALYIGAGFVLVRSAEGAPWALLVAFVAVAFSPPFGVFARQHVLGSQHALSRRAGGTIALLHPPKWISA